ncbi:MAG: nitroreductase family protein [Bacteroidales bacterium]|nr:nitroreductase family protein [Bacteroidales bacterium]
MHQHFSTFLDMVKTRESVRNYKAEPVPEELVRKCLEAARLAPSACNAQPWKFIVVDDPELKNAIADAAHDRVLSMNHFTKQAPVLVVVIRENANLSSNIGQVIKNKEYPLIDIGIAIAHFCLQAVEFGLGTCILGWFKENKIKKLLSIPKSKRVELIITLGYPATTAVRAKKRKDPGEISSRNRYE